MTSASLASLRRPEREPYAAQSELVSDYLRAVRRRLRAAINHVQEVSQDDDAKQTWPSDVTGLDANVEARIAATNIATFPILRIRNCFNLSAGEQRILWFLIAIELCPTSRRLLRGVSTEQASDPNTDTIRRVVYGDMLDADVWRDLSDAGALRRFGFVERSEIGAELPEHRQTWKIARRVLALVHGHVGLDDSLTALLDDSPTCRALDTLEISDGVTCRIQHAFDRSAFIIAHGQVGQGRRSALTAIAASRGFEVVTIRGRAIAKDEVTARLQLRAIARDCRLLDLVPLIRDIDALLPSADATDRITLCEQEFDGLLLATSAQPVSRRWKKAPTTVELAPLSAAQRARLWQRALPMATGGDASVLSTMYPLAPAMIEAAANAAIEQCAGGEMRPAHLADGMRAVLDDRLAGLATRVTVSQTWSDLVLPDDQLTAVVELLARIRERSRVYEDWGFATKVGKGLGVSALLSGPPGTGKTMTAGLMARSLNTEVYQVDMSKIVSKWIGETEKNLATLFDAAEAGHAILLFDEADGLFGKRSEVRSSNDRHANQEVNFLLQRLESYAGICILTTNHETAIDDAFRRRLSVHVRFPMPDAEERKKLWKAMLPAKAPRSKELPFDELADKFVMSGGYIKNAMLRAAFLAADEQGEIDAARLSRAAQLEYEAMGKLAI